MHITPIQSISIEGILSSKSYVKMLKQNLDTKQVKVSKATTEKMAVLGITTKIATLDRPNPYTEDVAKAARKITVKMTNDYRNATQEEILASLNFLEIICFHTAQDQINKAPVISGFDSEKQIISNEIIHQDLYLAIKDIEKLKEALIKGHTLTLSTERGSKRWIKANHSRQVKDNANHIVRDALKLISPTVKNAHRKEIRAAYKTLYRNLNNYKLKF